MKPFTLIVNCQCTFSDVFQIFDASSTCASGRPVKNVSYLTITIAEIQTLRLEFRNDPVSQRCPNFL